MLNGLGAAALAEGALSAIETQWAELKAEANQVRESLSALARDHQQALTAWAQEYLKIVPLADLDGEFGLDLVATEVALQEQRGLAQEELRALEATRGGAPLESPLDDRFESAIANHLTELDALRDELERFEFDAFAHLLAARQRAEREPRLEALWRFVTLGSSREERWSAEIEATLRDMDAQAALQEHHRLSAEHERVVGALDAVRRDRDAAQALASRHQAAWEIVHAFDEVRERTLCALLRERLADEDPALVTRSRGDDVFLATTRLVTLDKKRLYLTDLLGALEGEMRQRHQRTVELRGLIEIAAPRPDEVIDEAKASWLRSVADSCADLKDRMLLHSRALHHGVFVFDDYAAVADRRNSDPNALVYDVLCGLTAEAMPPDAFVRAVIPEVDRYRVFEEARE